MKHKINPLVDCVFKAILGNNKKKLPLIHFLNSVLELEGEEEIDDVEVMNPFNEKEFIGDKFSVVDVKVNDKASGSVYQIEIQLATHPGILARILYTWASIYHSMIAKGEHYKKLKPVKSIWILNEDIFPKINDYHLDFGIYNPVHGICLTDHLNIHLIELNKFQFRGRISKEKERWVLFFKNGKDIDPDNPPVYMKTKEMEVAMSVLKQFSEREKDYHLYQSRLDAEFERNTWLAEIKEIEEQRDIAIKENELLKSQVEKEKEQSEKEKEQLKKEKEELLKLLKKANVSPDNY